MITISYIFGRRYWNKLALLGQARQCDNQVSINNSLHPLKQNWDKFFHYRPWTCIVQMCTLMTFTWSQWAWSRRQTFLKIQARERWKILLSKHIGKLSTVHFWLCPYTHSVTLLKVSYDFFSFITTNFSANWTKACWTAGKSNATQKLPSSFNIYAASGIWQGTALSQKFAPP